MDDLKATALFIHYYAKEILFIILVTSIFGLILAQSTNVTFNDAWPLIFFLESIALIIYMNRVSGDSLIKYWSIYTPIYISLIFNVYSDFNSVLLLSSAIITTILINFFKQT